MTAVSCNRGLYTRSRSGCRTCRIRRVKCDETPGSCHRCTSSGRTCEGYDVTRLPRRTRKSGININNGHPLLERSDTSISFTPPGRTTDERRSFLFFQLSTGPMMNSWFNHDSWDHGFLQLSLAEPSVFHAVVAVASLHEGIVLTNDVWWSRKNDIGGHRQFALEQYGRAMAAIKSRMASNDPELRNAVLVCCYLFIVFELISSNCDVACDHLEKGIRILYDQDHRGRKRGENDNSIGSSLITSMIHLADQAAYFGKANMRAYLNIAAPYLAPVKSNTFFTLADAVQARNCILRDMSSFLDPSAYRATEETLIAWQEQLQVQLVQFQQSLDRLEGELRTRSEDRDVPFLSRAEQCGIHILRLHHAFFSLRKDLCSVHQEGVDGESSASRFSEIVERCETIVSFMLDDMNNKGPSARQPSHLMEIGIIQPLHYVCEQCVDQWIVRRARNVLESWPHREGLWTSRLALRLTSETAS